MGRGVIRTVSVMGKEVYPEEFLGTAVQKGEGSPPRENLWVRPWHSKLSDLFTLGLGRDVGLAGHYESQL